MQNLESSLKKIAAAAEDKKGLDIKGYNVAQKSVLTEYILVVGVQNNVHAGAILREIEKTVAECRRTDSENFYTNSRVSGNIESGWIIVDTNAIIIHIILDDLRRYYELDEVIEKNAIVYHY